MNRDLKANYTINFPTQTQAIKEDGRAIKQGQMRGVTSKNIMDHSFKKVAQLGVAIRGVRMANEIVGSYTNNRVRQKRTQRNLTFATYAVGIKVAGPIGLAYAASDMAYRGLMHAIDVGKQSDKARMTRELMGINVRENTRSRGEKL